MAFFPGDSLEKYSSASLWRLQLHEMLPDVDKVVYLADMTSKERDWPGVEKLRKLEMKDLDQDPATITIDATVFGMWTIIYR